MNSASSNLDLLRERFTVRARHRREDARADLAWLRGQIAGLLAPPDGAT